MASVIGWLDYSEDARRQMREIIDLFRDEDSIDELGIGPIRDTLADRLFPGLTTIQTRARYFLLVPWVYQRLEQSKVPSSQASSRARAWQTDLVRAMEKGGATGDEGIIGWNARENLRRLPAEVYWAGLKWFGIRLFEGSIEEYHRSLDSYHRMTREFNKGEGDEVVDTFRSNWNPHLPEAPSDLFVECTMDLSTEEAEFLAAQVRLHWPHSLLCWFLDNPTSNVRSLSAPWEHPASHSVSGDAASWLHHARLFSEVIHGAAITYNLLLAELAAERGLDMGSRDLEEYYQDALQHWTHRIAGTLHDVRAWDEIEFWSALRSHNPSIPRSDQQFASHWMQLTRSDPVRLATVPDDARQLIRDRELRKKRGKARLHHPRALEMWSGGSGMGRLTYRWPTARVFIDDIQQALTNA